MFIESEQRKKMKLIKTYNKNPNELQKASMTRAFKVEVSYELSLKNKVEVLVDSFQDSKILVSIIVNGLVKTSRIIGMNGGITVL